MSDTIAAISTSVGYSGIGIIRVSGMNSLKISKFLTRRILRVRYAEYVCFYDVKGNVVDYGIALFFKKPHSFTGEDLLELQCHGNPVLVQKILDLTIFFGARAARPGEFSLRAFLNKKIDLVQAESIYSLVHLEHIDITKPIVSTLRGDFSKNLDVILDEFFDLRMFVEVYLNFTEIIFNKCMFMEFQFLLKDFFYKINTFLVESSTNCKYSNTTTVVIAGRPNAGKSSLFNVLLNDNFSIVTDIPGTTRDAVQQDFNVFGIKTSLIDTAGLNYETKNFVELKGIEVSKKKMLEASLIIFVIDGFSKFYEPEVAFYDWGKFVLKEIKVIFVVTKVDLISDNIINEFKKKYSSIFFVSNKTLVGITKLKNEIYNFLSLTSGKKANFFIQDKDIDVLLKLRLHLEHCFVLYKERQFDCLAEELKIIQLGIMKITGKSYDTIVLDKIFSKFCIGK